MPSAVCPECHTHQATLPDGRLVMHYAGEHEAVAAQCPGSEDWPNRALGDSRYDVTSNFASCPAATGEARPPCSDFPDGSHRCGEVRGHVSPNVADHAHACTCGHRWTSLDGSMADLYALIERSIERMTSGDAVNLLRYAMHLRMYGENAPGGTETWVEFDRRAEAFLRAHPPAHNLGHPFRGHDGAPCLFRTGSETSGYCDRPESDPVHRNPDPDASGRG